MSSEPNFMFRQQNPYAKNASVKTNNSTILNKELLYFS